MWAALGYHRWDPELISFMSVYHAEEFNGINMAFVHGASFDFGPDPGSAYLGALALCRREPGAQTGPGEEHCASESWVWE